MSQDVNRSATNGAGGGLKSTLRVAVPIVALMLVIFGVTLFSQYTQKPQEKEDDAGSGPASVSNTPPLVFFTRTRMWDPPNITWPGYANLPLLAPSYDPSKENKFEFSPQDRVFAGFFEPNKEKVRGAAFWFENRNAKPVTMQLKGINCSACSGGRLAAIPPDVTRAYLQRTALAALPIGTFNAFGVGLADPAADFSKLEWTKYKFSEHPDATYKVPAAPATPDKWTPQWGILELQFAVGENPKIPLQANFATVVDGTQQVGAHEFSIYFAPAEAFAVSRSAIEVGEVNQLTGDREYQFLVYSATRGPGSEFDDLTPPLCDIQAPTGIAPGKFVEVTKIERLPDSDLQSVAAEVARGGKFSRVQSAYRVTVAVRPKIGDSQLDIGLMERTIHVTAGGAKPQSIRVTATVRGAVWLATGNTEVTVPTFNSRAGTVHTETLVTETAGMELVLIEDQCTPRFIKYALTKKEDRGGRGYYELKLDVPPGRQTGAIRDDIKNTDAVVVIEVKGPKPQRMRVPIKGRGQN